MALAGTLAMAATPSLADPSSVLFAPSVSGPGYQLFHYTKAFTGCDTATINKIILVKQTPRAYNPVVTVNGWTLPWRMNNGVKEFHLVAEPVVREVSLSFIRATITAAVELSAGRFVQACMLTGCLEVAVCGRDVCTALFLASSFGEAWYLLY